LQELGLLPEKLNHAVRSVEVLHIFDEPLPFSRYMPLIPTWILRCDPDRLFKFMNVVQRGPKFTTKANSMSLAGDEFSRGLVIPA
jgi:hypothetical protein